MNVSTHVILVEDEALIADLIGTALEDAGFQVTILYSGEEAMTALDMHADGLAALVTDVRLGDGPDGWRVARHGRELRPTLPVVYMTGDSAAEWPIQGVPKSLLLQKPFLPTQLVIGLSTLLNELDSRLG